MLVAWDVCLFDYCERKRASVVLPGYGKQCKLAELPVRSIVAMPKSQYPKLTWLFSKLGILERLHVSPRTPPRYASQFRKQSIGEMEEGTVSPCLRSTKVTSPTDQTSSHWDENGRGGVWPQRDGESVRQDAFWRYVHRNRAGE